MNISAVAEIAAAMAMTERTTVMPIPTPLVIFRACLPSRFFLCLRRCRSCLTRSKRVGRAQAYGTFEHTFDSHERCVDRLLRVSFPAVQHDLHQQQRCCYVGRVRKVVTAVLFAASLMTVTATPAFAGGSISGPGGLSTWVTD